MMRSLAVLLFLLCTCFSWPAIACSIPPTLEQWDQSLRALLNKADHVFVGRVERVTRRRWGPDDLRDPLANRWIKRKSEGRDIPDYIQNMIDFSDATARLNVIVALQDTGIDGGRPRTMVPIDLLRPFTQAGHGPCFSFPRTCPWDIEVGDVVAVAVRERKFGPLSATYCVRTVLPKRADVQDILKRRGANSADEMFWPYVEEARKRSKAGRKK